MAKFSYKKYARSQKVQEKKNEAVKVKSEGQQQDSKNSKFGTSQAQKNKFLELGIKLPCWLKRDYAAFEAFRCVGHMTKDQLVRAGLSNHRQKLWRQSGLIKEVFKNNENGSRTVAYGLTSKGYEVAKSEMFLSGFYTPQPRALEHDVKLADDYLTLAPSEKESWVTETELRNMFIAKKASGEFVEEEDKEYSTCDGAYVSLSGDLTFSESIGRSYTAAMIEAKENFAKAFGGEIRKY